MIYKLNLTDAQGIVIKSWNAYADEALAAPFALRIGEQVRDQIVKHRAKLDMGIKP